MNNSLLDPKVDFVFKNIFGSPKLEDYSDKKDMLVAWTEFLKNPESEKVRGLELSVDEIREAKDELIRMSNNPEERALYDMRAKILRDKISELNAAMNEGIEKGREEGREEGERNKAIEIARNMKLSGLEISMISKLTGLTIDEINIISNNK